MAVEWYRNTEWTPEISDHYFRKLARARSSRDQYLTIQAGHLCRDFPQVSLELVDLYFSTRTNTWNDLAAHNIRASAYKFMGDEVRAVAAYKVSVAEQKSRRTLITNINVEAAFYVASKAILDDYDFALVALAEAIKDGLNWPVLRFKFCVATAIVALHYGEKGTALTHAQLALEFAGVPMGPLRQNPTLGLVRLDEAMPFIEQMSEIVREAAS